MFRGAQMKRWLLAFTVILVLSGFGCGPIPIPITPHIPADTLRCDDACSHLAELGCPEAQPLEDGTTCAEFCIATQKSGHALRPSCVMKIKSCDQIARCQ